MRKKSQVGLAIAMVMIVGIVAVLWLNRPVEGFQMRTLAQTIQPKVAKEPSVIPRTVYQSWNTYTVPESMYNTIKENAEKNPAFRFELYDDERCQQYIRNNFEPEVLTAFNTLKPGAFKSDLWRLCVIYKEGGIYMDMKFSPVVPLEELIADGKSKYVQDLGDSWVYQGFFIAKPGESVLKQGIDKIVENVKKRFYGSTSIHVTGPAMLGPIINNVQPSTIVYKLVKDTGDIHSIRTMDGKEVVRQYPDYRRDQRNNGSKHYHTMWLGRDIYA